jgi:hypothetical protein
MYVTVAVSSSASSGLLRWASDTDCYTTTPSFRFGSEGVDGLLDNPESGYYY